MRHITSTRTNMAITPKFTQSQVEAKFDRFLAVVEKQQIERLQRLGEMCGKHARLLPPEVGFTDRTGHLRSSIGYTVFKDGVALHENYEVVMGASEGVRKAKELAQQIAVDQPGLLLVVVAGMNYAAALEAGGAWKLKSRRGYDVLASAEILAEVELPKMLKELADNINKAVK